MYIPPFDKMAGWDEIADFVESARAADLVTVNPEGLPIATLMPAIWKGLDPGREICGTLVMHMARANEQWMLIPSGSKGLAIVHGAQAYVSPTNYAKKFVDHKVVPTWNYQSVHLSGTVEVSEDIEILRQIVTELSNFHEGSRDVPWLVADADPRYFEQQLKGIVAVVLHITKVEAKSKISQNKSLEDRVRIIEDLFVSGIPGEEVIANEMQKRLAL
jgi:transcriptional regulator